MQTIHSFDESAVGLIGKITPRAKPLMVAVTVTGTTTVVGLVLLSAILALRDHQSNFYHDAIWVLVLLPVGGALKFLTRRRRPDTIYAGNMRFKTFSFPSGHAYGSLLAYGFLAYLAASWPVYIIAGCLIFLVGVSRVDLGAHFPSDVIGGWLLAASVLVIVLSNL